MRTTMSRRRRSGKLEGSVDQGRAEPCRACRSLIQTPARAAVSGGGGAVRRHRGIIAHRGSHGGFAAQRGSRGGAERCAAAATRHRGPRSRGGPSEAPAPRTAGSQPQSSCFGRRGWRGVVPCWSALDPERQFSAPPRLRVNHVARRYVNHAVHQRVNHVARRRLPLPAVFARLSRAARARRWSRSRSVRTSRRSRNRTRSSLVRCRPRDQRCGVVARR